MTSQVSSLLHAPRQAVINLWQRGVPVYNARVVTPQFLLLALLVLIGTAIASVRLVGGLGPFTGLTDEYAWGVWKTFNVMALTALGSGGLAVGIAAWVFYRKRLHTVMRTAIVTSFLFYSTGLLGLMTDMGRPWNFWNAILPWRWNTDSALWEVSLAMPVYAFFFLLFEASPIVVERFWYTGSGRTRKWILRWRPRMRAIYPFVIAGAYVVPMMHQSSLGALMMLAGPKVHPLWQTGILPFLYLMQAAICGIAFVIVVLMTSCLYWRRPLDLKVLGELSHILSWTILTWLAVRFGDLMSRGRFEMVFAFDKASIWFWIETALVFLPAVVLLQRKMRAIPRVIYLMAIVTCIGGLMYRFLPTTITYDPGATFSYFPTLPEVFVTVGLIAMAVGLWSLAVKWFAILPAPLKSWYDMVEYARSHDRRLRRDEHGNPIDD
jgi:Ni/Fe-hydrogenase subunit HybB-like protein